MLFHVDNILTSLGVLSETMSICCGCTIFSNADGFYGLVDEHEDIRAIALAAETGTAVAETSM